MRQTVLALAFCLLGTLSLGAVEAWAAKTTGEQAIGTSCTYASSAMDFDTIAQCSSTGSTAGTLQKAPLIVGAVTSPPYTSTSCDTNKAGMIQWTGTSLLGCNGSSWAQLY